MSDKLEEYRAKVAGTNIDPRSLLSTDYFNHISTVIMLFSMLPDMPEMLEEIEAWHHISYVEHFTISGLDFAPLAIEAYAFVPPSLLEKFERKVESMRCFVEVTRTELRALLNTGDKDHFAHRAIKASRDLQALVDEGGAIVHGHDGAMDQSAIDAMF